MLTPLEYLSALGLFALSVWFILKPIKNTTPLPVSYDKKKRLLDVKTAISSYCTLKNQIDYACKTDIIVNYELLQFFTDFLEKKLKIIATLLQQINVQEKNTLHIWVLSQKTNSFPQELIQLIDNNSIKNSPPATLESPLANYPIDNENIQKKQKNIPYRKLYIKV